MDKEKKPQNRAIDVERAVGSDLAALLLSGATDSIFVHDLSGTCLYVNEAACKARGFTKEELLKMRLGDLVVAELKDELEASLENVLEEGAFVFESLHVKKDGGTLPVEVSARLIDFEGDRAILSVARDISERKHAEKTVERMAFYDPLTDLPNRTLLDDRLAMALTQAEYHRDKLAIVFLDLDRFKAINETLGHAIGDRLLRDVADRLRKLVREGETIARLGGDEFIFILPRLRNERDAVRIGEKILLSLEPAFKIEGHSLHISASIGIAIYPNDGVDGETLLKKAAAATSRVKEKNRGGCQLYSSAVKDGAVDRLALEGDLRRALRAEEFTLFYQPQVDLESGRIVGLEALLRWRHPKKGLINPLEYISLAEDSGLIVPIGEWVFRTACAQSKAWQEAGLAPISISVNLSGRQFQQRNLVEVFAGIIEETGLDPRHVVLEITESCALQNAKPILKALREFRKMGVRIALDDFGTGYSSLTYLKRFPIDILKVDQAFVHDACKNQDSAAIISTIIDLAQNLKLDVVAEGVENEAQLFFLKEHSCKEAQGFYLSPPMPAEEATALLKMSPENPSLLLEGRRRSRRRERAQGHISRRPFGEKGTRGLGRAFFGLPGTLLRRRRSAYRKSVGRLEGDSLQETRGFFARLEENKKALDLVFFALRVAVISTLLIGSVSLVGAGFLPLMLLLVAYIVVISSIIALREKIARYLSYDLIIIIFEGFFILNILKGIAPLESHLVYVYFFLVASASLQLGTTGLLMAAFLTGFDLTNTWLAGKSTAFYGPMAIRLAFTWLVAGSFSLIFKVISDKQGKIQNLNNELNGKVNELVSATQILGSLNDLEKLSSYFEDSVRRIFGVTKYAFILFSQKTGPSVISSREVDDVSLVRRLSMVSDREVQVGVDFIELDLSVRATHKGMEGFYALLILSDYQQALLADEEFFNTLISQFVLAVDNALLVQQVKEAALTDYLTGLYNQRYFYDRFVGEIKRSKRSGTKLSLLIIDVDDFKRFNDTYGHLNGDKALAKIAQAIAACCRETDIAARYGGEEFVVILPNTDIEGALQVAKRIKNTVGSVSGTGSQNWLQGVLTVSIGAASYPEHGVEPREVIDQADQALYLAKARGKDRVVVAEKVRGGSRSQDSQASANIVDIK